MKKEHHLLQNLIWFFMSVVMIGNITAAALTNGTVHKIEKNLPSTLLTELNDLSQVLENMADAVSAAQQAHTRLTPAAFKALKIRVDAVYGDIVTLRESYVFDNLVKASAFHAVVAPAIADLQIWLSEGVSGFGPQSEQTAAIVLLRIREAYQQARSLIIASRTNAQVILEKEKKRLDRFLFSVNLLFVLAALVTLSMVFLLVRQHQLQQRESLAQSELREQRDLLNSLFEHAMLGILVWNPSGELLLMNNAFTQMTGYNAKDIGTAAQWFSRAFPDSLYRQQVMADWQNAAAAKSTTGEIKITCRSGAVIDIEFRQTFLPDGRALVTLADITERKKTERIVLESQEIKARYRKMESLGLLAGGVAHDLNNILSGIVSYPDLLLIDLPLDSDLRKPIQTMKESGQRAAAIVQDLLTVARGVATTKEPMNLNAVVRDYLNSPEFEKLRQVHASIKIETRLDGNLLNIHGSQVHIRKALMNLVTNAAEAIENIGTITVSTTSRYVDQPFQGYDDFKEGEYAVLSITDDGSGISAEDTERIFEPFYTKKVMGRSGTGLGLAVVWNIMQDHKGHIDLTSQKSHTTFNLYFPATREAVADVTRRIPLETYQGIGQHILVVDDVDSQREIAVLMLKKLNYAADAVASGEEAVAYLQQHDAELVILDMIMEPGINGRETFERILEIKPGQKAIITSGFAETEEVKKAQQLGAGRYIRKPFSLEVLGMAVREALEKEDLS